MKFKLNHIYSVLWEDHYDEDAALKGSKLGDPVLSISRGMVIRETTKMIVLSTTSPGDSRTSREECANLLKRDIAAFHDYGEEPHMAHKPKKPRKPKPKPSY